MKANKNAAFHKHCFSTNQRKKQNLFFKHMIRQVNVSCPPSPRLNIREGGYDRRLCSYRRSEERGARSEDRGSRIEDRGSRIEDRGSRIEDQVTQKKTIKSQKLKRCDRPARLPLYANVHSGLCL